MKKILLVAAQHGDELLGEKLYQYIASHAPDVLPHVTYVVANPLARAMHKRYIESDMNRSYVDHAQTYEEHLAQALQTHIAHSDYSLVLDLHTTTCRQPASTLMSPEANIDVREFVKVTHITYHIIMQHEIVATSLIGRIPQAISIEIRAAAVHRLALSMLTEDIRRYIHGRKRKETRSYFGAYELIYKTELSIAEAYKLRNFQLSDHGYYPILIGENSYRTHTQYLGFKANLLTSDI